MLNSLCNGDSRAKIQKHRRKKKKKSPLKTNQDNMSNTDRNVEVGRDQ